MPTHLRSIISGRGCPAKWTVRTFIVGILSSVFYLATYHSTFSTLNSTAINSHQMAALAAVKYLVVEPIGRHTATVIFVHGLGDTGHGWKPVADMFKSDPGLAHVKWILPHSPVQKVKANMDIEMPSWFNIYSFGFETDEDEEGMLRSAGLIDKVIQEEVDSGTDPSRIVLGGFSQGGSMSLLTGLSGQRKLAGIAVLAGWLPLKHKFNTLASPLASKMPIFWGHGRVDPLVKFQFHNDCVDYVTSVLGVPKANPPGEPNGLSYHLYEGLGHTTNEKELNDLKEWIKKAIPEGSRSSI